MLYFIYINNMIMATSGSYWNAQVSPLRSVAINNFTYCHVLKQIYVNFFKLNLMAK